MAKYNNPPIMEAVCEFKFPEDTRWDLTIPGLIYEEIRERFPNKEQRFMQEINIATHPKAPKITKSQVKSRRSEFIVFLTDDKKTLIQVGPYTLSISQLKPYSTWDRFKSQIDYGFNILRGKTEINAIQRIGLRYVNKIDIPMTELRLEDYFEFRPHLGPDLQRRFNGFVVGCMLPFFDEDRDTCKVQLTNAVPENIGASAFMLDIDYYLDKPQSISIDQSLDWVSNAHDSVEDVFEGCISGRLREIFGIEVAE